MGYRIVCVFSAASAAVAVYHPLPFGELGEILRMLALFIGVFCGLLAIMPYDND